MSEFRVYAESELGKDGYPPEWHATIKHAVRELAGHRCVRCLHPYRTGEHGNGEWSPCDERCAHEGLLRLVDGSKVVWEGYAPAQRLLPASGQGVVLEAAWRILTVHHLSGHWGNTSEAKADCRWWNLIALCQKDHLSIQGRVIMDRAFVLEHSAWFKPYAAGFYAWKYEGREINREEANVRMDELLAYERIA